jgi:hypothetical protein
MQTGATQVPNRAQAIEKNCKTSAKKNLHLCAWQKYRLQKARSRSTSFQRGALSAEDRFPGYRWMRADPPLAKART